MAAEIAIIEHDAPPAQRSGGLVLPVGTPDEMRQAMQQYEATKRAVLEATDYQTTSQGKFVKKSGWAKLAIAFGVSSQIMDRRYDRDSHGALIRAEFVVRATAPNGRYAEGWGECSLSEPRFKSASARQKIDHDLPATAETRARNRAYAALFAHGEVSFEEIDAGEQTWDQVVRNTKPGNQQVIEQSAPASNAPLDMWVNGALSRLASAANITVDAAAVQGMAALGLTGDRTQQSEADKKRLAKWAVETFKALEPSTARETVPAEEERF